MWQYHCPKNNNEASPHLKYTVLHNVIVYKSGGNYDSTSTSLGNNLGKIS